MSKIERIIHFSQFTKLVHQAFESGKYSYDFPTLTWRAAGSCSRPVEVAFKSRAPSENDKIYPVVRVNDISTRFLIRESRCRKCEACLEARRKLWTFRAYEECNKAPRNWWITFTLSPDKRHQFFLEGLKKNADFNRFESIHYAASKELTNYFKKVRKAGYKFRYILVVEKHKDGDPHYHLIVHEVSGEEPIPKRVIQSKWQHGLSTVKLCDGHTAGYLCKYLSKSMLARVRASKKYGPTGPTC